MSGYTVVEDLAGRAYEFVPDGVHIGLPDALYFAQDALGSSDLIRLAKHKHGWWWQSRWNPHKGPDKIGRERTYGSGAHAIILEGVGTYEERFAVMPDKPADALETIGDIQAALTAAGYSLTGTSGWRAEDWHKAAHMNLPLQPCWPNIVAEFHEGRGDLPVLSAVDDRMLRIMHQAAMDNPVIRTLLDPGGAFPPLAEVSVFKTMPDGIRRRWRFDRLFPQFTLDLKTLGNWSGRPLKFAVGDHIGRNGYEIQRGDYDAGRVVLSDFVRNGFEVYGGTLDERDWLRQVVDRSWADGRASWDWVWLFYQKPEPTGRAPVLFPVYDDAESDLYRFGRAKAAAALEFYREAVKAFGLLKPWTSVEPLHLTVESREQPFITLPHWIGEDAPADADAYPDEETAPQGGGYA